MFNKCALNAFFVRPGRMRRVKCDNRNEEKGHFPGTALGIDVITAAYHLVWAVLGSTVGHGAEVKGDMLQFTDDVTGGGKKNKIILIPQAFLFVCHVMSPTRNFYKNTKN